MMFRTSTIPTRATDKRRRRLSFNSTHKIILVLLVAALATIPLWLGLTHVRSAPSESASPPASPTPSVTIAAPAQALIGTQVKFKVTFTNGTALGYGPFLDVVLDAGGKDGGNPSCTCDGITFVSAQMVGVNGGPIALTPSAALTAPCGNAANPITHPFSSSGVLPVTVPAGGQLITLALPFGSFQPNQPPIEVEITANMSINADAGYPLAISARGGFRFGKFTPVDDPSDPPVFSDESSLGTQIVNSAAWIAQATITPAVMIINKKYLGPEGENATGPNFIGYYPLRYELTVDIAPGQTIANVVLTDCLPDNMAFHQLVSVTPAGTSTLPPIDIPSPSGCLTVNWSSLTGSAAVVFEFFIPEKDAQGNPVLPADCTPAISKDTLNIKADWTPVDPCDGPLQHLSQGPVVDTLLDKCIAIQKGVAMFTDTGAAGYTPGDTLQYTLNFQISDYKTFSALEITDSLGDGQKLVGPAPTLVVKDQFGTVTGSFVLGSDLLSAPYNGNDCGRATGGTKLTFLVSQKMISLAPPNPRLAAGILTGGFATTLSSSTPATGQIVFQAEILDQFAVTQQPGDQFVDKEDPLSNCVVIGGKLMTNVDPPALPTSTGVDGHDDSSRTISIVGDKLEKTVYAVKRANNFGVFNPVCGPPSGVGGTTCSNSPNPPQEVRPGDRVTYRLEKVIPSSDAENLVIEDWLPKPTYTVTGINFANSFCTGIPTPGNSCLGPGDQMHGLPVSPTVWAPPGTNSIKFDYGTINDTANTPRKIDLLFTYQVTNLPFADELFLTNEAQECETNTFGTSFCQVAIAQVNVRQPNLQIHKGTIATDNPNGVFTHPGLQTATLSTAQDPAGATFSLAGVGGVVNHADVAAGLMDSNVSNVDANDVVTFAITIENLGGSPAYDVKIEDIIPNNSGIPSCFTIIPNSIVVKRGTGAVVPSLFYSIQPANPGSTTTSFTITSNPLLPIPISAYNATSGANIVTVTFQAKLLSDIMPGCCDNTVNLLHYSSTLSGPDFVSAGLTPPFTDTATVCVNPVLIKSLITTSEAHTSGANVTIGEIVRYRLAIQLPETGLLTNFKVTDALPAGQKFLNDGTARIAFISNGTPPPGITHSAAFSTSFDIVGSAPISSAALTALPPVPASSISAVLNCGDPVTFDLGNVQNNDNDNDLEYIVIEFNALVCNEASNQDGTTPANTFNVSVGGNQIATSNSINVTIVEPNLIMTKTVAPNPAVKGQTLTYTVQYTNNGTADAFNVDLKDTLPSGLTLGTVAAGCPFTSVGNVITMTCAQVPKAPGAGSTVIVTYQAVANPATCPVTLNNQANLTWTSLPGPQGTLVNPTGSSTPGNSGAVDGERDGVTPLLTLNDYATTASAAVKIDCPCEAMITGLKFNDLNGNGVQDTGEPGLANWTIQVTDSNGITHATTTDSAGNYSLTVPAPGTYTVAEVLQPGWTQTAPTTGTYSVTVSPGQVVTNLNFGNRNKQKKCDLKITKEVKPNPLVNGQQATAVITVKNVGTGPCHGPTQVAESMPAGLTLVSATVPGGSCVLSTGVCNYAPAIPAGGSVVFTYVFNVIAQPGGSFENCAKLKNSEDQNATNNGTCVPLTVSDSKLPDLTIKKEVKCTPTPATYVCKIGFTITNNGPGAYSGFLALQDVVTPTSFPFSLDPGSSNPPGWSCSISAPGTIGCNGTSSVTLAPSGSTSFSFDGFFYSPDFKNCGSVKGYTQPPFTGSTLIQEGNFNNNESCVGAGGSSSGDCTTVPLLLFNTGVADNASLLADGEIDPHYSLILPNGSAASAQVLAPAPSSFVSNNATSKWIGPGNDSQPVGVYIYRLSFTLTDCQPESVAIKGRWSSDNQAVIRVNGRDTNITTRNDSFKSFSEFVLDQSTANFRPGLNTLDFVVTNSEFNTGLRVEMSGTVKCCSATGSLTVTKTVENLSPSPIPAGTTFPVTVSCLPSGPNVTLNLAAGETKTLDKIPVGSKCTVTEAPLPTHISNPVCASLQWAAPTYSPGQSVTILNSGAPQKVTIQNRLVCSGRPPDDTYTFTRGMNEFCFSSSGGSFNSPSQNNYVNSQFGIDFPTQPGDNRGVRYGAIGLCYGRILAANNKLAFKYTFNATPVAGLSYPEVNPVFIDRPGQFPVSATRRNVFGVGLSPIGLQLYFRPQSRIKPFVNTSGGFIFFKDQVPRLNGARFNFTYDVGGGVQVFRDANRAFTLGYKYQRISNGGRALSNPGFNGNVFTFGYSLFKTPGAAQSQRHGKCPWPHEQIPGLINGLTVCLNRPDGTIQKHNCLDGGHWIWGSDLCVVAEKKDHVRVRRVVDDICPDLTNKLEGQDNLGRIVCRSRVDPGIQRHNCWEKGKSVWNSPWGDYCLMETSSWYVNVKNLKEDICPGARDKVGTSNGYIMCKSIPSVPIKKKNCNSFSQDGNYCLMEFNDNYWYRVRRIG